MLKKILLLAVLMSLSLNLYAHGEGWYGNVIIKDADRIAELQSKRPDPVDADIELVRG